MLILLLTVSKVEGRSISSVVSLPLRARLLVPLTCLAILPLLLENYAHTVDGVESGRVVHSECLLLAIEGSLVPLKRLATLPLPLENKAHVDGVESGRVVHSECLLLAIEGSLVPLKCLAILPFSMVHVFVCRCLKLNPPRV